MTRRILTALALATASLTSVAQDIHFSQYYAAPLTLNPAATGDFDGLFRFTGIYRNQWLGVSNVKPFFSTPSVGVDFALLDDKFEGTKIEGSKLGVGLHFTNDQQNESTFSTNQIGIKLLLKRELLSAWVFKRECFLKTLITQSSSLVQGFCQILITIKILRAKLLQAIDLLVLI